MTDNFFTDKAKLEESIITQMQEFSKKHGVSIDLEASFSYLSPLESPNLKSSADMNLFKVTIL